MESSQAIDFLKIMAAAQMGDSSTLTTNFDALFPKRVDDDVDVTAVVNKAHVDAKAFFMDNCVKFLKPLLDEFEQHRRGIDDARTVSVKRRCTAAGPVAAHDTQVAGSASSTPAATPAKLAATKAAEDAAKAAADADKAAAESAAAAAAKAATEQEEKDALDKKARELDLRLKNAAHQKLLQEQREAQASLDADLED